MNFSRIIKALLAGWELLLDISIPAGWTGKYRTEEADPRLTLLAIPVVGLVVSLLLLIPIIFFRQILPSANGAAILSALLVTVLLDAKDSGRGIGLLLAVITMIIRKIPILPALPQLRPPSWNTLSGAIPTAALVLLEMLKLSMWFLIFRNHAELYLIVVIVLSFTVQGVLMTLTNLESRDAFLPVAAPLHNQIWFVAIFLAVFVGIFFPLAVLLAVGAAIVLGSFVRGMSDKLYGGVTADIITLAGAATEILLLFIGGIMLS